MGFFDPEPKKRKEEFFNMEEEWKSLSSALSKGKLTVVTGLRRYGKTSLMLTFLNEAKKKYIYVDCRLLPRYVSLGSFLSLIETELERASWGRRIMSKIGELEVRLGGVDFKIKSREEGRLLGILRNMEGSILVIDEAQYLINSNYPFDALLAYAYDHLDLKMLISGSEVGVLYKFLKLDDPEAPLYGRAYYEVKIKPLTREKSTEFLLKGFEQEGLSVREDIIEDAVNNLDGVIGWLTYFGYSYSLGERDAQRIYEKAARLAAEELNKALDLFEGGKTRYVEALKVVAVLGSARWSEIKRGVEARLGPVSDAKLSKVLKNLADRGFLTKTDETYRISDPVLSRGILKYL